MAAGAPLSPVGRCQVLVLTHSAALALPVVVLVSWVWVVISHFVVVTSTFHLSDDGHGGTYLVDPPVAGFAQAMATTGDSGLAGAASYAAPGSASLIGAAPLVPTGTASAGR